MFPIIVAIILLGTVNAPLKDADTIQTRPKYTLIPEREKNAYSTKQCNASTKLNNASEMLSNAIAMLSNAK